MARFQLRRSLQGLLLGWTGFALWCRRSRLRLHAWDGWCAGFGCCTPTLERETPDDRDKPPAPLHDRGHDGPQPVTGDPAILRARGRQVRPLLRPFAGATWPGGGPHLPGAPPSISGTTDIISTQPKPLPASARRNMGRSSALTISSCPLRGPRPSPERAAAQSYRPPGMEAMVADWWQRWPAAFTKPVRPFRTGVVQTAAKLVRLPSALPGRCGLRCWRAANCGTASRLA